VDASCLRVNEDRAEFKCAGFAFAYGHDREAKPVDSDPRDDVRTALPTSLEKITVSGKHHDITGKSHCPETAAYSFKLRIVELCVVQDSCSLSRKVLKCR
jgi:hypothetical protein